ncbi:hypothetical protein Hanom_Chr06g00536131 [Helianthus anomalus]
MRTRRCLLRIRRLPILKRNSKGKQNSRRSTKKPNLTGSVLRDLAGKDVEIAELKRRLREAQESLEAEQQKNESMVIDLATEKVKADTAEEAHKISLSALNVAYTNYAEVQSIVEQLLAGSDWMQHHGITHIANSILNATELDKAVAALTMVARAAGHRAGYVECTMHVEKALKQKFGTRHCSVGNQA